jgi:hypothetical protein
MGNQASPRFEESVILVGAPLVLLKLVRERVLVHVTAFEARATYYVHRVIYGDGPCPAPAHGHMTAREGNGEGHKWNMNTYTQRDQLFLCKSLQEMCRAWPLTVKSEPEYPNLFEQTKCSCWANHP